MNEQIKELARLAKIPTYYPEGISEKLEKFAELIVRECAGVAEVSMSISSHPDDRLTVKNSVLKHFGVEE